FPAPGRARVRQPSSVPQVAALKHVAGASARRRPRPGRLADLRRVPGARGRHRLLEDGDQPGRVHLRPAERADRRAAQEVLARLGRQPGGAGGVHAGRHPVHQQGRRRLGTGAQRPQGAVGALARRRGPIRDLVRLSPGRPADDPQRHGGVPQAHVHPLRAAPRLRRRLPLHHQRQHGLLVLGGPRGRPPGGQPPDARLPHQDRHPHARADARHGLHARAEPVGARRLRHHQLAAHSIRTQQQLRQGGRVHDRRPGGKLRLPQCDALLVQGLQQGRQRHHHGQGVPRRTRAARRLQRRRHQEAAVHVQVRRWQDNAPRLTCAYLARRCRRTLEGPPRFVRASPRRRDVAIVRLTRLGPPFPSSAELRAS
ncbi:hypothetical protein FOCC_FOCC017984, partial [Frankliniella occidentalis]